MALFESGGDGRFWAYHDAIYAAESFAPDVYEKALQKTKATRAEIDTVRARSNARRKVDEDMALARALGVYATPTFFINGVPLSGSQPIEKFRAVIDREIVNAKLLVASGTEPEQIHDASVARKLPSRLPLGWGGKDKRLYYVPIAGSPARDKPEALVTIVGFLDFQCPDCIKSQPTLDAVRKDYGDKLRFIFKHNPLASNPRAEPAAELALEARAQKGDTGFREAHDRLWTANGKLSDDELAGIAGAAGLKVDSVQSAVANRKHRKTIEVDQDLADDLDVTEAPTFYINGRRIGGALPLGQWQDLIDEELAKVEALVKKGVPAAKVYEAIQKNAIKPEKRTLPEPTAESPVKGAKMAKVTIQVFSDFQCPLCKKAEATITQVLDAYPGKVRLVWRNLPLVKIYAQSALAAEAAMEARAQQGDGGFWKMHALLFQAQGTPGGLTRATLEQHAATVGLDAAKFAAALKSRTHKVAVERDRKIAARAGISNAPAFVIDGYLLYGAQPFEKLRRLIDRALREPK